VSWVPTYTQMAWYDPSAYGFKFAFGRTVNDSAATDFLQYGLTGKILGMPMPTAFTSSESYWYNPDFPTPPLYHKYDYQNFFDYRAKLWKSCDHVNGDGLHSIDFYIAGYGEWLYDAITRTGALLPHCATQWTNNADACTKAPYAWLIQGDQQIYFSPPDTHANRADALWGQKCAEIQELWPSYDFARPAAGDKFIYDETHVYCVTNLAGDGNGSTWTLVDYKGDTPADGLDVSGTWGGQSVGGFYSGCSYAGGTLTLGTKVFDVPSDWKHALNADEGTCIGKLRYPTAPAILGRMNVVSVADIAASRLLVAGSLPDLGLDIPQAETVDICAADMTVLAGAVIPTRVKAWAASTAYTVGQVIIDGHGALQTCTTGGTSDASAPTWGISGTTTDASVTWTFTLAGSFAPDTTFTVPTALATIATAKYIVSHGATNYEWDDNARKLDFVTLEWLFNYRVPQEIIRLAGATDCSGASIALSPTTAGYLGFATFNQTQYENATALKFNPCCPSVICISPNAETWKNGVTIPFPATFNFDSRYGARWQMEIEQAMADLLWQTPAKPCGFASGDRWLSDDGTCQADAANDFGGTNKYYAHAPFVEARITVPNYGGNSETDTAPTPPTGIGYLSPVTDAGGLQPPGMIGFDIGSGNPNGAWTFWGYRINIEQSSCPPNSCRFSYADTENLPCKNLAVPTDPITDPTITGLGGLS